MNLLQIAWKSLRQRSLASSLTMLSVALGVALMVTVLVINGVITNMFAQSGSGYNLIIGPKGSPFQLILSTVYRAAAPIENLPYRYYLELKEDPRITAAIPIAIGDTTEEGQFPIVGTLPEYFANEYAPDKRFRIPADENFIAGTWDAVIGSAVARTNGWNVGDTFKLVHSGADDHVHNEEFTIRGVLERTGTPNDKTAFVHLNGFYALDEHATPLEQAFAAQAEFFGEDIAAVRERYKDCASHEGHNHSGHHHHELCDAQKEVSAVFVKTVNGVAARLMQGQINSGRRAQAENPVIVMRKLMTTVVGNIKLVLVCMTVLIIAVSGIGIFVSIYNSMSDRKKDLAVMRALGAKRRTVLSVILFEAAMICGGGALLGVLLGHGLIFIAAPIIAEQSGLLIDPWAFDRFELSLIPLLVVFGAIVGFLPGLSAYRTDVAKVLSA